ncbi:MAG: hypothetical protein V2I33_21895, partial [Kangiellaceae bacterium]|nr:hypothetical protein [Kangiellaceae bacterium]
MKSATDDVEEYILRNKRNQECRIPSGLLQGLYGAFERFPSVLASGISRAMKTKARSWGDV